MTVRVMRNCSITVFRKDAFAGLNSFIAWTKNCDTWSFGVCVSDNNIRLFRTILGNDV